MKILKRAADDYADFYYDWCMPLVSRQVSPGSVVSHRLFYWCVWVANLDD